MTAWYNEIDPGAAEWLRELIKAGHIAPGDVDERSIEDVRPDELKGYTQCHFFAGIGGWSLALRLAGWPDDRPVWTGSCPCQPFSAAGKGDGFDDERHLWPAWHHLVRECRPATVFGEQVASKDGLMWLDLVQADLEGENYACGAGDLCSAGFGAPHIRQRLGFVAHDLRSAAGGLQHTAGHGRQERWPEPSGWRTPGGRGVDGVENRDGERRDGQSIRVQQGRSFEAGPETSGRGSTGRMGYSLGAGLEGHAGDGDDARGRALPAGSTAETGEPCGLADGNGGDSSAEWEQPGGEHGQQSEDAGTLRLADPTSEQMGDARQPRERADTGFVGPLPTDGFWRDADWLLCTDGKWRPVEPGTFPLAHGVSGRVGLLRGYGNAINPRQFQAFIEAYLEREVIDLPARELTLLDLMEAAE